ncbi:ATP-binding cassette domain-containing protein [Arsenicitalea aurantiaca]|nr:ATP-binding cassette domain-containing protein [Arsenicitalea aurantiaca]
MLVLDDVRFSHGANGTPYRFSMSAAPGEVTAISGPSGSGKSTLLDLIAGFLRPSSGAIKLDGVDLLPPRPERRPLSILFQSDAVFDHLSAGANVALGLPRNTPRAERGGAVSRALADMGLAGLERQRASTLSGGQKQRVALARTLLRDKPLLLLDEPFSALDDENRARMRALIARLTAERGWTTILVSHHEDDIAALARQTYAIRDGELVPSTMAAP